MFENRSEKQLIAIYAIIAILVALGLALFHILQGLNIYYIIVAVNIEFFCIFYILYLPLKVKRSKKK
jgi:hypothetical protein